MPASSAPFLRAGQSLIRRLGNAVTTIGAAEDVRCVFNERSATVLTLATGLQTREPSILLETASIATQGAAAEEGAGITVDGVDWEILRRVDERAMGLSMIELTEPAV